MSSRQRNAPKRDEKFIYLGEKRIPLVRNCKPLKARPLLKNQTPRNPKQLSKIHQIPSSNILKNECNPNPQRKSSCNQKQVSNASPMELFKHEFEVFPDNSESENVLMKGEDIIDKIVRLSSELETDLNITNNIISHILSNEPSKLKKYLESLENPHHVISFQMKNVLKQAPVSLAILNKCSPEIISILLRYGANALQEDENYRNAFHYAIEMSEISYFLLLIEYICENIQKIQNPMIKSINLNTSYFTEKELLTVFTKCDINGNTLIMQCIIRSQIEILEFILNIIPLPTKIFIINYRNPCNGITALCIIGELNFDKDLKPIFTKEAEACAKLLLLHGANPYIKNYLGLNCEEYAYKARNFHYYNFLKKYPYSKEDIDMFNNSL